MKKLILSFSIVFLVSTKVSCQNTKLTKLISEYSKLDSILQKDRFETYDKIIVDFPFYYIELLKLDSRKFVDTFDTMNSNQFYNIEKILKIYPNKIYGVPCNTYRSLYFKNLISSSAMDSIAELIHKTQTYNNLDSLDLKTILYYYYNSDKPLASLNYNWVLKNEDLDLFNTICNPYFNSYVMGMSLKLFKYEHFGNQFSYFENEGNILFCSDYFQVSKVFSGKTTIIYSDDKKIMRKQKKQISKSAKSFKLRFDKKKVLYL
jgi:hypothetical protein